MEPKTSVLQGAVWGQLHPPASMSIGVVAGENRQRGTAGECFRAENEAAVGGKACVGEVGGRGQQAARCPEEGGSVVAVRVITGGGATAFCRGAGR